MPVKYPVSTLILFIKNKKVQIDGWKVRLIQNFDDFNKQNSCNYLDSVHKEQVQIDGWKVRLIQSLMTSIEKTPVTTLILFIQNKKVQLDGWKVRLTQSSNDFDKNISPLRSSEVLVEVFLLIMHIVY